MNFGKRLTKLRQLKGLSQVEMAQSLGIAKSTYHGYENDKREPDIQKIRSICKILETSSDELLELKDIQMHHSDEELELLKKLSLLDEFTVKTINLIIDTMLERQNSGMNSANSPFIYLDIFPLSPDSSNNNNLDSGIPAIKVKNTTISQKADFIVIMSGDSMLPRFFDGDMLFIKKQNTMQSGDYGLFAVNGKYYIRQYGTDRLIALNTEYRDIYISENEGLEIIGKILGKM